MLYSLFCRKIQAEDTSREMRRINPNKDIYLRTDFYNIYKWHSLCHLYRRYISIFAESPQRTILYDALYYIPRPPTHFMRRKTLA